MEISKQEGSLPLLELKHFSWQGASRGRVGETITLHKDWQNHAAKNCRKMQGGDTQLDDPNAELVDGCPKEGGLTASLGRYSQRAAKPTPTRPKMGKGATFSPPSSLLPSPSNYRPALGSF